MFGAVNSKDGEVFYSTCEAGNPDTFKDFLNKLSKRYVGKKVILPLDNVKYHHTNTVKGHIETLGNIEFKYLPPYSSDLNAIEHLWRDIRNCVTHNYLFESINHIIKAIGKYFMTLQRFHTKVKRLCAFIC